MTKFKEKDAEGKTVFEVERDKEDKVVAIGSSGAKTVIELVHISEGSQEVNSR